MRKPAPDIPGPPLVGAGPLSETAVTVLHDSETGFVGLTVVRDGADFVLWLPPRPLEQLIDALLEAQRLARAL